MTRRSEHPEWPERHGKRQRVLVENVDMGVGFAAEHALQDAGFEVAVCGGPEHLHGHRCPLVEEGGCGLAEGADAVVHSLNPDLPEHAAVLRAFQEHLPDVPVVVEVPEPAATRHAELLAACTVVPLPATKASLVEAVRSVLASP